LIFFSLRFTQIFTFTLSLFYLINPPILTDLSLHPRHLATPTSRATAISPMRQRHEEEEEDAAEVVHR
ncbi:unnamed protein product, partial [Brassica oleracea var. botrytis]